MEIEEEEEEQSYGSFYAEDKISKNTMIQNTKIKSETVEQDNNDKNTSNDQQFNHSIIELHEKIKNTVSSHPTPRNENSVEEVPQTKKEGSEFETPLKNKNNLSSLRKKVAFLPNNSLQSATKSIKTETDIKEEIPHDSEEEKEEVEAKENEKENNENFEKKHSNYLPASVVSSFKLEKLKLQKEKLNKSFKINSTNSKSSEKKNPSISITIPTPTNSNKAKTKNLILPRISSASNLTNKKTFLLKPTNNNLTVIPHTNIATISNVNKKINYNPNQHKPPLHMVDKELKNLEKENISLIKELQNLNAILSDLVVKKIPLTVPREKKKPPLHLPPKHPRVHSEERNNEMEKNSNKKYLNNLINEYNSLYKIYSAANNPEKKDELEKKIEEIEKEYQTNKVANNELKKQIIKNENYLNNFEQEQTNFIKNIEFLNAKYDLYKIKIVKKEKEIERMAKLVENEKEKISDLQKKYNKLTEILKNYEETPNSLNQKLNEDIFIKQQEEKLQNLIKKKNIISHSRISAKKSFEQEIEKQKKYIEQLKSTISEVDTVLSNL